MKDVKMDNLELFYDCLDESNNVLYEATKKTYFELIEMTVENILQGEVVTDVDDETVEKLKKIYDKIADIDFSVEDVRKAMQSIILRGFKEMRIPNGNTTPDTLGIFAAYLITKLTTKKNISILDPLCGTGNLLFTIVNYLDKEVNLFACDHDLWMTKLTQMNANLMGYETEIYLQDTFNLHLQGLDFIVCDMPNLEHKKDEEYFPYKAILHYSDMLVDEGAMIAIVTNDFFDYDKKQDFKKKLLENMSIIGLVELPENMSVIKPKIILVLQKKEYKDNKCFMVKLPSFSDVKEFNTSLMQIEAWFEKNK